MHFIQDYSARYLYICIPSFLYFCILYSFFCILYSFFCILYPLFCILYPLFCILYPLSVSCILYSVSCILSSVSCILYLYPVSFIPYPVSFILYPVSFIMSFFILYLVTSFSNKHYYSQVSVLQITAERIKSLVMGDLYPMTLQLYPIS